MNLLRGWLLDNLGLKLVALLLAVLVYLNVYTDRPATMIVTFPIHLTDLPDSLSLSGPAPATVQAELRGTAKQLIRLRVTEPPMKISLAGVSPGRYERALGPQDLPLPNGVELQVERMVSPRTLELQIDRRGSTIVPVAVTIEGQPAGGALWDGTYEIRPGRVRVTGPAEALRQLDTVRVAPVSVAGRRDTVRVGVGALSLPDWCAMDPERVQVIVPLEPASIRRVPVEVEPPRGVTGYRVTPARVSAVVTAPRRLVGEAAVDVHAVWWTTQPYSGHVGRRVLIRSRDAVAQGIEVRFEPDSVTLQRANP